MRPQELIGLLDRATVPMGACDRGTIRYVNQAAARLLGRAQDEIEDRPSAEFLVGSEAAGLADPALASQFGGTVPYRARLARPDGSFVVAAIFPMPPVAVPSGAGSLALSAALPIDWLERLVAPDRPRAATPEIGALLRLLEDASVAGRALAEQMGVDARQACLAEGVVAAGPATAALGTLTPKERECVEAVLSGRPLSVVARALGISVHTLRNHLKSVYRKLGVHSRVELLLRFRRTR